MDIHVQSPDKRAIAQVLGRYFESRSLRYHIEELPGGVLQIGFRASGRPSPSPCRSTMPRTTPIRTGTRARSSSRSVGSPTASRG